MAIELVRYSQEVDVENPEQSFNFLVFKTGTREFRVRVSSDTIKDLVRETMVVPYVNEPESTSAEEPTYEDEPFIVDPYTEAMYAPPVVEDDGVDSL